MTRTEDLRTSARLPVSSRVEVVTKGKAATYVLAINISLGGVLLSAAPSLPVGSTCKLAIFSPLDGGAGKFMVEGTIIRNDAHGTAVKFFNELDHRAYNTFNNMEYKWIGRSITNSYLNYFQVSQSANHEGSELLLGVSGSTFKVVFLTSFFTCIPLAILPVWAYREAFLVVPNWLKIVTSFGYALTWIAIIQPFIDITIFKILKSRSHP